MISGLIPPPLNEFGQRIVNSAATVKPRPGFSQLGWLYCVEVPEKGTVHVYGISRNLEETQKIEAAARRVPGVSARCGNPCCHRRVIGRGWQEKGGVAPRKRGIGVPRFCGGWPQQPHPVACLNTTRQCGGSADRHHRAGGVHDDVLGGGAEQQLAHF
jgi:hypothetical protein